MYIDVLPVSKAVNREIVLSSLSKTKNSASFSARVLVLIYSL